MQERSSHLDQWLERLGYRDYRLCAASADASFRHYLRLHYGAEQTLIVMDAPPQQEPCDQFIAVAGMLRAAGLNAPEVIEANLDQGFLLLTDLGGRDYLAGLDASSETRLYADALVALRKMQTRIDASVLPDYDTALLEREMDLFQEWFLGRLLGISLTEQQQDHWRETRRTLVDNALAQPRVFVHRDYHSRNLMITADNNPGILDFQDAVRGPITYDLVSLLRDCYIAWPIERVEQLATDFYVSLDPDEIPDVDLAQFLHWFDLMGIQRHLKAIGIFSRLKIRDGKAGYLGDIPRTFEYLRRISDSRDSMNRLSGLIAELDLRDRIAALDLQ